MGPWLQNGNGLASARQTGSTESKGACTYPFYIPLAQQNPKGLLMFIPLSPTGYIPLNYKVGWKPRKPRWYEGVLPPDWLRHGPRPAPALSGEGLGEAELEGQGPPRPEGGLSQGRGAAELGAWRLARLWRGFEECESIERAPEVVLFFFGGGGAKAIDRFCGFFGGGEVRNRSPAVGVSCFLFFLFFVFQNGQ